MHTGYNKLQLQLTCEKPVYTLSDCRLGVPRQDIENFEKILNIEGFEAAHPGIKV
jgi:hypothetical protein